MTSDILYVQELMEHSDNYLISMRLSRLDEQSLFFLALTQKRKLRPNIGGVFQHIIENQSSLFNSVFFPPTHCGERKGFCRKMRTEHPHQTIGLRHIENFVYDILFGDFHFLCHQSDCPIK